MDVNAIVRGLEACDATGAEADCAARMGFLEWVFTQPQAVTARDACLALGEPSLRNPTSEAARAFAAFLRAATRPVVPRRRDRSAPRLLH